MKSIMDKKNVAIILAGGRGSRMESNIKKQYLPLGGEMLIYYAVKAFNDSSYIDEIVLVTNEKEYVLNDLVKKHNLKKVKAIALGGKERRDSVYNGLLEAKKLNPDIVLIHDGARPFVDDDIIRDSIEKAKRFGGAVAACKVKDTIKLSDESGFILRTPPREFLYSVQTPQTFKYDVLLDAYEKMIKNSDETSTDDAMVVEKYGGIKVCFSMGSYKNIKITTREDLDIARVFLEKEKK